MILNAVDLQSLKEPKDNVILTSTGPNNRAFSSRAWLIIITCCGNRVLYAESSKLGKLTSEILNDLQLIVKSYKYLKICNPH